MCWRSVAFWDFNVSSISNQSFADASSSNITRLTLPMPKKGYFNFLINCQEEFNILMPYSSQKTSLIATFKYNSEFKSWLQFSICNYLDMVIKKITLLKIFISKSWAVGKNKKWFLNFLRNYQAAFNILMPYSCWKTSLIATFKYNSEF